MKAAISLEELKARLAAARDETSRRLFFSASLAQAAGLRGEEFIVVGGSAIELYTSGEYTSADIDIVATDSALLRSVLASWGFKRSGRGLESPVLGLFVDLVKPPYTGSAVRTRPMGTPYGPIQVAAVEDLIVKRLLSTRFWKVAGDLEHAKMLAFQYFASIDWGYLEEYARSEEVLDLAQELRSGARDARETAETPKK